MDFFFEYLCDYRENRDAAVVFNIALCTSLDKGETFAVWIRWSRKMGEGEQLSELVVRHLKYHGRFLYPSSTISIPPQNNFVNVHIPGDT